MNIIVGISESPVFAGEIPNFFGEISLSLPVSRDVESGILDSNGFPAVGHVQIAGITSRRKTAAKASDLGADMNFTTSRKNHIYNQTHLYIHHIYIIYIYISTYVRMIAYVSIQ